MFLALNEMRHEKVHYGLIVAMVTLIGYLIFMLLGLMLGLAKANTAAVDAWQTQTVVLNKGANINLNQSIISSDELPKLKAGDSLVGQSPLVITSKNGSNKQSAQLLGLKENQPIAKKVTLSEGRWWKKANEVVLADTLKNKGYHLNQKIKFSGQAKIYRVVGFAKQSTLNVTPIIYSQLGVWQRLKGGSQFGASAIFSTRQFEYEHGNLKSYSKAKYVQKLPGYSAQSQTFAAMIGFLMVISMAIIGVFLYILTMQKLPNYAVLRAQGISAGTLIRATVSQAVLLMVVGGVLSLILTALTSLILPEAMPFLINWPLAVGLTLVMIILGTLSSVIPVKLIQRVQPLDALR